MNRPYSQWNALNAPTELPLAARYRSSDPILWNGSMIYPMYTEQLGPGATLLTLTVLSAAPPPGLRGLGMGLSMVDGFVGLDGKQLGGVDVWSDALAAGVTFELTATTPGALFTLTPVWVDAAGQQQSWSGNYGILVEHTANGRVALWCSIGEGPANFANLVVEISTATTGGYEQPATPAEYTELAPDHGGYPDPAADTGYYQAGPQIAALPAQAQYPPPRLEYPPAGMEYPPAQPDNGFYDAVTDAEYTHPAMEPTPATDYPDSAVGSGFLGMPPESEQPATAWEPEPRDPANHVPGASTVNHLPHHQLAAPIHSAGTEPPAETGYRSALYDLGVAMFSRGEEEEARGLFAQAAAAGHAGAAYDLGVLLFRSGQMVEAERWWRTAADRRESRAMTGLAELLDRQGNHSEARVWRAVAAEEHG